jgi:hypothetical protein
MEFFLTVFFYLLAGELRAGHAYIKHRVGKEDHVRYRNSYIVALLAKHWGFVQVF